MGPCRGGGAALLLSRLALRYAGPVPRHAVRDRGVPHGDGGVAARLPDDGIWRARLRLYGPAWHRTVVSALRHHRPGLE